MRELRGKVAVVTGGGSGIGRGIAHALAGEGTHVVIADIDGDAASAVAGEVRGLGVRSIAVPTDVSRLDSVRALAEAAYAEFGEVHLLCNNAGVLLFKSLLTASEADWDWVLSVNLKGPVNGVLAFLPRMRQQSGERHIVNTGSISGLVPHPGLNIGIYTASKYGVVGFSEALRADLEPLGIGVSVLCPGGVATRISDAGRNRPDAFGGPFHVSEQVAHALDDGMDPLDVGRLVLRGIKENRLYIQTHHENLAPVEARFRAIAASFAELP